MLTTSQFHFLSVFDAKKISNDFTYDGVLALSPNKLNSMGDEFMAELKENRAVEAKIFALYSGYRMEPHDQLDLL